MRTIDLIPSVKHITRGQGIFSLKQATQIKYPQGLLPVAQRLNRILGNSLSLKLDETLPFEIIVGNVSGQAPPQWRNHEAYDILVVSSGILLRGASARALFYAAVTLEQLAANPAKIPEVKIEDWPDLPIRAYHLDLKGAVPTFKFLQQLIKELGKLKINTLVMEYEDAFPFVKHRDLCQPGAISSTELSVLLKIARDYYMDTIPLLQSHGHVEYIVSKPAYQHLAEPESEYSEFCPNHPETIKLFASLVEEILKYHGESRYFHVGGDEAYSMGNCPKCREAVKKKGRLGLYIEHLNRIFDVVMSQGKIPIFWDDMLWMYGDFDAVKKLRPGVVACHWDYISRTEKTPRFLWNGGWYASRRWLSKDLAIFDDLRHWRNLEIRWIEEADGKAKKFARRYWKSGNNNLEGDSFAMVNFLKDQGIEVIGASCAKGVAYNNFFALHPFFQPSADNIQLWGKMAHRKNMLGVIGTGWSRYVHTTVPHEPIDICWYPIVLSAQSCWSAGRISRQKFDGLFNKVFLQTRDDAYTFAIRALDVGAPLELARARLKKLSVNRNRQVMVRHIALAVEFARTVQLVDQRIRLVKHENYLYRRNFYHCAWVAKRREDLEKSKLELKVLASRMKNVMGESLKLADTEEFISSLIRSRVNEIDSLLKTFK